MKFLAIYKSLLNKGAVQRLRRRMKHIKTKCSNQDLLEGFPCEELGDDAEPVSPSSAVYHEPDFNVHIVAVVGFKTKMDHTALRANLADSVLRNPRFSSLQVKDEKDSGRLKWVRTTVNLEEHVPDVEIKLENVTTPEKAIEDYILNLTQTPLPKSRPLWDLHIINLKTKDAEAVVILRVHHSLGDGSSLISLLLACTRQTANPEALPTIPTPRNKSKKKLGVWGFLTMLCNSVLDMLIFMMTTLFLKDTQTPLTSPPGVEFTPRRMVYRILSLDDMKLIKNHLNATVNDVALGITQAGFSRYLNAKYGQILGKNSSESTGEPNCLPRNIRFRTALLMNLRPAGIKTMTEMMEENSDAKYGNGAGFVLLPIKIFLHDDPLDYIRDAKASADRKKNSLEAVWTSKVAGLILKIFGSKWESKLFRYAVGHTTGSFSNLVGPLEEVSFYGHEVAFVAAGCYGLPQGVMIHFVSYVDKMTMALSVDETTIPDPDKLCDEIEKSLELVKNAALKARQLK